MDAVRQALQRMGCSMGVVVQDIYNVMDLCNDGALRKLSAQGTRNSGEAAGETTVACNAVAAAAVSHVTRPTARRSVIETYALRPKFCEHE